MLGATKLRGAPCCAVSQQVVKARESSGDAAAHWPRQYAENDVDSARRSNRVHPSWRRVEGPVSVFSMQRKSRMLHAAWTPLTLHSAGDARFPRRADAAR